MAKYFSDSECQAIADDFNKKFPDALPQCDIKTVRLIYGVYLDLSGQENPN